MPNVRLDRIRDVFCFCALTGLITSRFFGDHDHITSLGSYYATIELNLQITLGK